MRGRPRSDFRVRRQRSCPGLPGYLFAHRLLVRVWGYPRVNPHLLRDFDFTNAGQIYAPDNSGNGLVRTHDLPDHEETDHAEACDDKDQDCQSPKKGHIGFGCRTENAKQVQAPDNEADQVNERLGKIRSTPRAMSPIHNAAIRFQSPTRFKQRPCPRRRLPTSSSTNAAASHTKATARQIRQGCHHHRRAGERGTLARSRGARAGGVALRVVVVSQADGVTSGQAFLVGVVGFWVQHRTDFPATHDVGELVTRR